MPDEHATEDSRRAFADEVEYALAASAHTRRVQAAARRRRRRHTALTAVAVVLACIGVAVVALQLFGNGTQTSSTPPPTVQTDTLATQAIPDFVWVPAHRATRYRIEFTQGGHVVLRRTTTAPRLHLAASTLPAGTYHWRVTAIAANGSTIGAPIVDASVAIR